MAEDLKDTKGDRYKEDQTFGANAAKDAEKVDQLEAEGGADAVEQADPGERTEGHAAGKAEG